MIDVYDVRPRYTIGAGAHTTRTTALDVASQERHAYADSRKGLCGSDEMKRAFDLGLRGIVEYQKERKGGLDIQDLVTGEHARRLHNLHVTGSRDKIRFRWAEGQRVREAETYISAAVLKLLSEENITPDLTACVVTVTTYFDIAGRAGDIIIDKVKWPRVERQGACT